MVELKEINQMIRAETALHQYRSEMVLILSARLTREWEDGIVSKEKYLNTFRYHFWV